MANALSLRNSAFSPDISGLQIAWDSTSLGTLKECPRKYQLSLIEGWQPRETSVHLDFGRVYHKALEAYDHAQSRGHDKPQSLRFAVFTALLETWDFRKGRPIIWDMPQKNRETLVRSVIWYLLHFENDPCTTVQLANGKPAVELSFRVPLEDHIAPTGEPYILCGHLDRVVEFQDHFYILDRKTTKSTISPEFFTHYSPDNQMQIYNLAGGLVWQLPTRGIIIDAAQLAVGFTRFQRGFVTYTQAQNEEFYLELGVWFKVASAYALSGYWPKNEKSCGNYGGCVFRSICSKTPGIREDWLKASFFQRVWDPLQIRGDI